MSVIKRTDEWFFKTRSIKPKEGGISVGGGSRRRPALKRGSDLANLKAAARRHPEVMVKIPRRHSAQSKGIAGVRNHLDYVSRNGEIELENQHGEKLHGKQAVRSQTETWRKMGIPENSKRREAVNIVLSMPAGTPPKAVLNAAREFAAEQFDGHQYVFGLHHHSEREGEPPHPHVHLCVLLKNEDGRRLNPRKNDLFEWRVRFAEKLRDEGVQCAATRRQHRGKAQKPENGTVLAIRRRGGIPYTEQSQQEAVAEAVRQRHRPSHPYLADAAATRAQIATRYAEITRALLREGLHEDAALFSDFAREVAARSFDTKAQQSYDRLIGPAAVRQPDPEQTRQGSLKEDEGIGR